MATATMGTTIPQFATTLTQCAASLGCHTGEDVKNKLVDLQAMLRFFTLGAFSNTAEGRAMRTIELFEHQVMTGPAFGGALTAGRHATPIVLRGTSQVNPLVLCFEAVCAVLDAASAFFRYQSARQQTKQLEAECQSLEGILENEFKQFQLEFKSLKADSKARQAKLTAAIKHNQRQTEASLKRIALLRGKLLTLNALLRQLRQTAIWQASTVSQFILLEKAIEELEWTFLNALLAAI